MNTQRKFIDEYKLLLDKYYYPIKVDGRNKGKIKGAIAANLVKKYIEEELQKLKIGYIVSEYNVFIKDSPVEFDLLILKQDAKPVFEPCIYDAEDVIAIIECKATGIWIDKKKLKNPFEKELEAMKSLNEEKRLSIKFGYISVSEQIGKDNRLLQSASKFINEYSKSTDTNKGVYCFSKTYPEGVYPIFDGNAYSFGEYIASLCNS